MSKISLPYTTQLKSLDLNCDELRRFSFAANFLDTAKRFQFDIGDTDATRGFTLAVDRGNNFVPFTVVPRGMSDAVLGLLDPYTLGALDGKLIDFQMWDNRFELVPEGLPGADGNNIFLFSCPVCAPFDYREQLMFPFEVGKNFMWNYWVPKRARLYIRNSDRTALPALQSEIEAAMLRTAMYLKHNNPELLTDLVLYCKSVLGARLSLSEMDPFDLGAYDPLPMWRITNQAATALTVQASKADAVADVYSGASNTGFTICAGSHAAASQEIEIETKGITNTLISMRARRDVMLGDIDSYAFTKLDAKVLGMHCYGKTPAIVTIEAE